MRMVELDVAFLLVLKRQWVEKGVGLFHTKPFFGDQVNHELK